MKKNWLPFLIGFFITLFLIIGLFLILIFIPKNKVEIESIALITVIPAATSTPMIELTIVPTPTTEIIENIINPYKFQIGEFTQIAGTSGDGLRLRSGPSRTNSVNFIGMDSEVFEIVDGPIEADGFVWWYLEAPYDKTRNGWSVDEYLQSVNVP
ncbi:MAG TPA: hypothetical protein VK856_02075 [Anaerolineaceae bacterium]|nr:hypothetical protein [Anaerolineaceae bacterium]